MRVLETIRDCPEDWPYYDEERGVPSLADLIDMPTTCTARDAG
jgi:hypothetical protein